MKVSFTKFFKVVVLMALGLVVLTPSFAQSITLREGNGGGCIGTTAYTIDFSASNNASPARNIYLGGTANNTRVIWTNNRWEVQVRADGSAPYVVYFYSIYTSHPNPPDLATGGWVDDGCPDGLAQFDGTGTQSSITLPIELINFNAATEMSKNHLTWSTASETNNKGFDIERSRDGETYQAIGTVKANGKAGNYNFTDAEPVNGTNYYRLRQIDFDGTETYSKVVSVANKGGKSLKVYPTLVSNGFLAVDTEGGDYSIYNIVGQQVQSGKTAQRLDVSALAKGTYFLKVGTEQAKFVKQ